MPEVILKNSWEDFSKPESIQKTQVVTAPRQTAAIGQDISRSEQAPGSVFHPRDENTKIDCGFLEPFCVNKKLDPER